MAITIPDGCFRQPSEEVGIDPQGMRTMTVVLKGPYESLDTLLKSLETGTEIVNGWHMVTASLTHVNSAGLLTIPCSPTEGTSGSGDATETHALTETWKLRSVRNDVSILGYCGSGPSNPCREWIEAWQKEPDGEVARIPGFRKNDGSIFKIDTASESSSIQNKAVATTDLIAKIEKGIESVMRFYPMLIKVSTFTRPPKKVYEKCSYIDTPGFTTAANGKTKVTHPGNLSAIISAHEWLKCQDDVDQTADGNWTRTESWIGCLKSDGGWDADLYGESRWPMPYDHNKS